MAITKRTIIGKIEILPDQVFQIREDTQIIDDDGITVIAETYHRRVVAPGDDTTKEPDKRIDTLGKVLWTPEVIKAYKDKISGVIRNAKQTL